LKGKTYVDECSDSLYAIVMLSMVKEESLTALICWVPLEDVELGDG
jgi:hypothetical protein